MFSPFQSKNFFPCGSIVIVQLIHGEDADELIEDGDAVLVHVVEEDYFAIRNFSHAHFYPSNPNFRVLTSDEAEIVGRIDYCIQEC
jgi:hypothetical protein